MTNQQDIDAFLAKSTDEINKDLTKIDASLKPFETEQETYRMFVFGDKCHQLQMTDLQRSLRGMIINSLNEIVSRTFSVPYELGQLSTLEQTDLIYNAYEKAHMSSICAHELLDGTLLRLSHFDNKWHLLTNSKTNAYTSTWNRKSTFGSYFDKFVTGTDFYDQLDFDHTYAFVLCHPENTIIVSHKEPVLYHVATIDNQSGAELKETLHSINLTCVKYVTTSPELSKDTISSLLTNPDTYGWVFVINSDQSLPVRYRCPSSTYVQMDGHLGMRQIDPKFRQLALRSQIVYLLTRGTPEQLLAFENEFPGHSSLIDEYSSKLVEAPMKLYTIYRNKYINKSQAWIDHPVKHKFMQYLHNIYLTVLRPQKQILDPMIISTELMSMESSNLVTILDHLQ